MIWRRSLFLVLVAVVSLMALASRSLGRAGASRHTPRRPATVVLRPKWRIVARSGAGVLVFGRYVFIGRETGAGVLVDEQTGRRVTLAPPTGCYLDGNSQPLGASWMVATCNPPPPGPRYLYELYSIPNGTWTPFSPDVQQMFAFNADCKTGDPQCGASYTAIGSSWIEFQITCGYHCGPTTVAFENIQSRQVVAQPQGWQPGGTEIPDLSSPTLTHTLCAPLTVPSGFTDPTTGQTDPGTIVLDGRFAVAQQWSAYNLNLYTYLERCGSSLHKLINPGGKTFAANAHAVAWGGRVSNEIDGLFLPSLQPFKLGLPERAVLFCDQMGTGSCTGQLGLTSHTLYLATNAGQVWTATIPLRPPPSTKWPHR